MKCCSNLNELLQVHLHRCCKSLGAKQTVVLASGVLFGLSLILVSSGVFPPYSEDTARAVNVVHVVDTTPHEGKQDPSSYVSLFSITPGKLEKEVEQIGEGFLCGRDKVVDFVNFEVKYGCWTYDGSKDGWSKSDLPILHVDRDTKEDRHITEILIDTKTSTRWSLAINTEEIEDFILKGNSEDLVSFGNKSSTDGWHIIQFSGGKQSPRKFKLTLFWAKTSGHSVHGEAEQVKEQRPLLKLRTDVDRVTPKAERVIEKLPAWCSQFGKSSSPHTLAFLSSLPVNF